MCTLNRGKALPNNMYVLSNNRLCYDMFFDERLRGPQPMDSASQDLIVESLTEDLYNPTIPNDDLWKKFALPTPPYSPENYLSSCKRNLVVPQRRNGLQVVPEPEDLSSDLPLVLSDAEMERLTSSTIDEECIWPAGDGDFDRVEFQRLQGNRVVMSSSCVGEPSAEMATEQQVLRGLPPFVTSTADQDPQHNQQQVDRWHAQFSENSGIGVNRRSSEEFVLQRFDCVVSKRPRKSRRSSRNSPQRQDSIGEGDDSEDNEISRATHNVLERQRREDLKCRFQLLRDSIPELEDNDRASKVLVLKKARDYVHQLILEEQRLLADRELERQRRLILLERLQYLRQGYAVL